MIHEEEDEVIIQLMTESKGIFRIDLLSVIYLQQPIFDFDIIEPEVLEVGRSRCRKVVVLTDDIRQTRKHWFSCKS